MKGAGSLSKKFKNQNLANVKKSNLAPSENVGKESLKKNKKKVSKEEDEDIKIENPLNKKEKEKEKEQENVIEEKESEEESEENNKKLEPNEENKEEEKEKEFDKLHLTTPSRPEDDNLSLPDQGKDADKVLIELK